MAADQHVQDDAVDAVVLAVDGDGADVGGALAEPVDAALALFVPGGVPGQVVVDDGLEGVLEVDALGQAVGGDQDVAGVGGGQAADALLAFGGGRVPVTAATSTLRPRAPSRCSATYSAVSMNRQNTIGS